MMSIEQLTISKEKSALLLVDLQPDFFPGGALAFIGGDEILPGVRELMQSENSESRIQEPLADL